MPYRNVIWPKEPKRDALLSIQDAARRRTFDNRALTYELSDVRQYIINTDAVFDHVISMDTLYCLEISFQDFENDYDN